MKKLVIATVLCVLACNVYAQEQPRLAVVAFTTNVNTAKIQADAATVRNLVESRMVSKYHVISRQEIDKLLENQRIQASDISSAENMAKLQLQNISYIVTGSVDAVDNGYLVTVKMLDVSTGRFSHSEAELMGSQEIVSGVSALVSKFIAGMDSRKEYKIGDIGPAGGIVFYDKGAFSGGWRYLEAAPADAEFTAAWGAYGEDVAGTGTAVGSGKRNTQLIEERLRRLGESGMAAQLCVSLDYDGYTDWFLPSKDELDLMYQNLKRKGLGSFSDNRYWSSSHLNSVGAWYKSFSAGLQYGGIYKDNPLSVRAARSF